MSSSFSAAEGEGKHVQDFYSSVSPPTSAFLVRDVSSLVVGVYSVTSCDIFVSKLTGLFT